MPLPDVPLLDDFTRANNGSIGANYTESVIAAHGGVNLLDNAVNPDASATDCSAWWNVETFGPDCVIAMRYARIAAGPLWRLYLRLSNPGGASCSGYQLEQSNPGSGLTMGRMDNTAVTALGPSVAYTMAANDWLLFAAWGSLLMGFVQRAGSSVFTKFIERVDGTYSAAGYGGFMVRGTAGAGGELIDDLYLGRYVPGLDVMTFATHPNRLLRGRA